MTPDPPTGRPRPFAGNEAGDEAGGAGERATSGAPAVVAEVRAAFAAYEAALVAGDLAGLAAAFAEGDEVVRFGLSDAQYGATELAAWRAARAPLPPGRRLQDTVIATYRDDLAVVSTTVSYPGRARIGRQQQTWVRFEDRWRIVAAHVSEVSPGEAPS